MKTIACPSCGAQLVLLSPSTIFVVCSYCRNTLLRDQDWQVFGKMAELPAEITPLQLGSKGVFEGETFELIGRQRLQWADGFWTEWCANFPKGKIGWIAEAQGMWMISFPVAWPQGPEVEDELKVGDSIQMGSLGNFLIDDIKSAKSIGSEGEMPFPAPREQEVVSIDASNTDGRFLNMEKIPSSGEKRAYLGRYFEFTDLKFTNLRVLDGW